MRTREKKREITFNTLSPTCGVIIGSVDGDMGGLGGTFLEVSVSCWLTSETEEWLGVLSEGLSELVNECVGV